MDIGNLGDFLLPPPQSVTEAIPPWLTFGSERCRKHDHAADFLGPDAIEADPKLLFQPFFCDDCGCAMSASRAHRLACGNYLCRNCLNTKGYEEAMRLCKNPGLSEREVACVREVGKRMRLQALNYAGFMCCDQVSDLVEFIDCMDPDVGKTVFLDFQFLLTSINKRRWCGWSGCGRFVPVPCSYQGAGGVHRWYCMWCGGNSQAWPSEQR